jgi:hypothetical protein
VLLLLLLPCSCCFAITAATAAAAAVHRPSETQKTSVKFNDNTPRWCETFDFVMISAGSMLTLSVMNKTGILDATLSLKMSKVGVTILFGGTTDFC